MFTDSHCHLLKEDYEDVNEIIEKSYNNKITKMIASGCDYKTNKEMLELISKYDYVYATIGIQPNEVKEDYEITLKQVEDNINNPKVVGLGEMGLDYHYEGYNEELQKKVFRLQLELAKKYNKKVIIHSRDATKDTIDILKEYPVTGVIHSFSGSYETAQEYIKMGYALGINGVVTFKNSHLKEVIVKLDLKDIIFETDSPYLTPEPFRGTKNDPSHIMDIAKYVAQEKCISVEKLSEITEENINRIFDI